MYRIQPRSYALAALFLLASLRADDAGAQQKALKEQLVLSRVVLELGYAAPGGMRLSGQAASATG